MAKAFAGRWTKEWAILRAVIFHLARGCCLYPAMEKARDFGQTVAADFFAARFWRVTEFAVCLNFDFARFATALGTAPFPVIVVVAAAADFAATTGSACFSDRSLADLCLFSAVAIAEAALVFAYDVSSVVRSSF